MISNKPNTNIFLTAGGSSPGVDMYNPITDRLEKILTLPAGQSVYAVDVSSDGNILAAGTRGGNVYRIAPEEQVQSNHEHSIQEFRLGASVLSVCFIDPLNLAISDTAGRCLIWHWPTMKTKRLPVGNGTVCSLFRPDINHLVGLSSAGELLIWDLAGVSLVRRLRVAVPSSLMALASFVHWPNMGSLVWPAADGQIVLWKLGDVHVETFSVHQGDVRAIAVYGDMLITIGREDGRLRCWQSGSSQPVTDCRAPEGVISASVWKNREYHMILVNEAGQAGLYEFSDSKLECMQLLSGHDYRLAFASDVEKIETALTEQENHRAEAIAIEIQEKVRRTDPDGLDRLHEQLVGLGYEHVSLVLRGDEARMREDLISELEAYKKLSELAPWEHEGSRSSLIRYATLLESLWQFSSAHDLYRRLSGIYPSDSDCMEEMKMNSLVKYSSILDTDEYIIETDIPLDVLIRAAMIVGRPFLGRYLIKALEPQGTGCTSISPDLFIARYEQVRCLNPELSLPQSQEKVLWQLSKNRAEQIRTVILGDINCGPIKGLELGIQFFNANLQQVLVPVVLFNAGSAQGDSDVERHNSNALRKLQQIENRSLSEGWLRIVHRHANHAIRQLITKELSASKTAYRSR